jgi:hypothetical protein
MIHPYYLKSNYYAILSAIFNPKLTVNSAIDEFFDRRYKTEKETQGGTK